MSKKVVVITDKGNVCFVNFGLLGKPELEIKGAKRPLVGIAHISDIKKGKEITYYNTADVKTTMISLSAGKVKEAWLLEKKVA